MALPASTDDREVDELRRRLVSLPVGEPGTGPRGCAESGVVLTLGDREGVVSRRRRDQWLGHLPPPSPGNSKGERKLPTVHRLRATSATANARHKSAHNPVDDLA
jgi:hypothetical protein